MSHDQHRLGAVATSSGLTRAGWAAWRRLRAAMGPVPARTRPPKRPAGRGGAHDRRQGGDGGLHGHAQLVWEVGSVGSLGWGRCWGSALLAASLESSAEGSPWASSTRACRASWSRKRAFSARSRALSRLSGSTGGRPRRAPSPSAFSAPRSRCLRHSLIREVYRLSRRSRAPLPALSSRSYSARTRSLYAAGY